MISKVSVKLVLSVFVLGILAFGTGICADVQKDDVIKAQKTRTDMASLTVMRYEKELGLTDAQKASIKAIQTESRAAMKSIMDERKNIKNVSKGLSKSTDTASINEMKSNMKDISNRMMEARKSQASKISEVLTAEQKTKLVELYGTPMNNN